MKCLLLAMILHNVLTSCTKYQCGINRWNCLMGMWWLSSFLAEVQDVAAANSLKAQDIIMRLLRCCGVARASLTKSYSSVKCLKCPAFYTLNILRTSSRFLKCTSLWNFQFLHSSHTINITKLYRLQHVCDLECTFGVYLILLMKCFKACSVYCFDWLPYYCEKVYLNLHSHLNLFSQSNF